MKGGWHTHTDLRCSKCGKVAYRRALCISHKKAKRCPLPKMVLCKDCSQAAATA